MHIDIHFSPFPLSPHLLSDRTVVVIDILRATSVMVHAMLQGAQDIIPVRTVEEAFQVAKTFPQNTKRLSSHHRHFKGVYYHVFYQRSPAFSSR